MVLSVISFIMSFRNMGLRRATFHGHLSARDHSLLPRCCSSTSHISNSLRSRQTLYRSCALDFKTAHAANAVLQMLEKEDASHLGLGDIYSLFVRYQQSSILASWILLPISHRLLRTSERQKLPLYNMQGNLETDAPVLDIEFSAANITTHTCLTGSEREAMQFSNEALACLGVEHYYVSDSDKRTLLNSFLVDLQPSVAQGQVPVLWVFQIYTASSHNGSREGYASEKHPGLAEERGCDKRLAIGQRQGQLCLCCPP
ncbi:unnamed protein product [Cyclocybe aegerita]|uniref:Uncharacterized protein n=1 Tax=Cyclocybe aegerita TaxID=1973307 RepID=A0A8S0VYD0_CYCAE|nr:unnamed protein product [Cyclocybe aegerita]